MNPEKLADFFYSSNNNQEVPFRISISTNLFEDHNLNKKQCTELLKMLNNQKNYCRNSFQDYLSRFIYH